jgi:hypothetical protein
MLNGIIKKLKPCLPKLKSKNQKNRPNLRQELSEGVLDVGGDGVI